MASAIPYLFLNDCVERVFFTAVVFPSRNVIVSFPADANGRMLASVMAHERLSKLLSDLDESGTRVDRSKCEYFEVSPYPERMVVTRFGIKVTRRLFGSETEWIDDYASDEDVERLNTLARGAGLPTLEEYYQEIQAGRAATKSFEDAAHEMVSSWSHWRPTAELLGQLRSDLATRYEQVKFYKHGWHYVVDLDGAKKHYRSPNTEAMLRSFIFQAEAALNEGKQIRFAYCLPQYMPEGIDWKPSPVPALP